MPPKYKPTPVNETPISAVPEYVKRTHGVSVTRATVYNWAKLGKKGLKLQTTETKHLGTTHYATSLRNVDAFLAHLGIVKQSA